MNINPNWYQSKKSRYERSFKVFRY